MAAMGRVGVCDTTAAMLIMAARQAACSARM